MSDEDGCLMRRFLMALIFVGVVTVTLIEIFCPHKVYADGRTKEYFENDSVIVCGNDIFVLGDQKEEVVVKIPLGRKIDDLIFSNDGKQVYLATAGGLWKLDTEKNEIMNLLSSAIMDSCEISSEGKRLYLLVHPGDNPFETEGGLHYIQEFDVNNKKALRRVALELQTYDIFVTPDGRWLYSTNQYGRSILKVNLKKMDGFKRLQIVDSKFKNRPGPLRTLTFSPNSKKAYIIEDGLIKRNTLVWIMDIATEKLEKFELPSEDKFYAMAISNDGSCIYLNAGTYLCIVDIVKRKDIGHIPLDGMHRWIALSNDGKRVYLTKPVSEKKGYVTIVDIETSKIIGSVEIPGYVDVIGVMPE